MKRFQWRLQRVLDIKQKQQQVKRAELVEVTERLSQARGELFMQKRILEDLIDNLAEADSRKRMNRQAFFMTCSAVNDAAIKSLENKIQTLGTRQQEKKRELMKIKQFNEGLEKLRTEAQNEFIRAQEKLEQKDLNETSTARFARQMMTQSEEVII